jgi:hypothetical protein
MQWPTRALSSRYPVVLPRLRKLSIKDTPAEVYAILRLVQPDAWQVFLDLVVDASDDDGLDDDDDGDKNDLQDNHNLVFDFWLANVCAYGDVSIDGRIVLTIPRHPHADCASLSFSCADRRSKLAILCYIDRAHHLLDHIHTVCFVHKEVRELDSITLSNYIPPLPYLRNMHTVMLKGFLPNYPFERRWIRLWIASRRGKIKQIVFSNCAAGWRLLKEELREKGMDVEVSWLTAA